MMWRIIIELPTSHNLWHDISMHATKTHFFSDCSCNLSITNSQNRFLFFARFRTIGFQKQTKIFVDNSCQNVMALHYISKFQFATVQTRMHSSRMRTTRFSGRLGRWVGFCSGCATRHPCPNAWCDTAPLPVDRQTPVKPLPFRNYCCGR